MQQWDIQSHFWILTLNQSYQSPFILLAPLTTMTCKNPQTSKNTLSCNARLDLALKSYQNNPKQSVRGLAKQFEVAPSTLQDWLAGGASCTKVMSSRHCLGPTKTKVLASHALEMQKLHFPLTQQDIRPEARHIWYSKDPAAEACGDMLGVNWYNQVFLKDNLEMVNKMGKGLDWDRATCTSHLQLAAWYEDVHFEFHKSLHYPNLST